MIIPHPRKPLISYTLTCLKPQPLILFFWRPVPEKTKDNFKTEPILVQYLLPPNWTCSSIGVYSILDAQEAYIKLLHLFNQINQIFQGSPKTIEFPHYSCVTLLNFPKSFVSSERSFDFPEIFSSKMIWHPVLFNASICMSKF